MTMLTMRQFAVLAGLATIVGPLVGACQTAENGLSAIPSSALTEPGPGPNWKIERGTVQHANMRDGVPGVRISDHQGRAIVTLMMAPLSVQNDQNGCRYAFNPQETNGSKVTIAVGQGFDMNSAPAGLRAAIQQGAGIARVKDKNMGFVASAADKPRYAFPTMISDSLAQTVPTLAGINNSAAQIKADTLAQNVFNTFVNNAAKSPYTNQWLVSAGPEAANMQSAKDVGIFMDGLETVANSLKNPAACPPAGAGPKVAQHQ